VPDAPLDSTSERSRGGVLATVRAHWAPIVGGLVVGAILGYVLSALLPTEYTAESTLVFNASGPFSPVGEGDGDEARFISNQAAVILYDPVLQRAADATGVPLEDLRETVTAVAATETSQVTVTAVQPTAEGAVAVADAVVAGYRADAQQRVTDTADTAVNSYTPDPAGAAGAAAVAADNEADALVRARAASYGDGVAAVRAAEVPESPSAPLPLQNALIGGLVGLFLVTGVYLLLDQRKAKTASVADLDLMLGAPLLSRYPSPSSRAIADLVNADLSSDRFRAANDVLTAIDVRLEGLRRPSVLFLSWQNPLSTTALTVSVALAAAREGRPVVLVDGGGKERGISSLTDVTPGRGLEGLANLNTPINASLRTWRVAKTELGVVPLPEWSPTPTSAAARPQVLRAAMERLRENSVLNLVDGPPLTERSLGLALGRGVDGVVLVLDEDTSVDDAQEMGRRIGLAGVSAIGYVLVRPPRRRGGRGSGGGSSRAAIEETYEPEPADEARARA
jgi:capsular polysaccharide biosynthesis protein